MPIPTDMRALHPVAPFYGASQSHAFQAWSITAGGKPLTFSKKSPIYTSGLATDFSAGSLIGTSAYANYGIFSTILGHPIQLHVLPSWSPASTGLWRIDTEPEALTSLCCRFSLEPLGRQDARGKAVLESQF
jgi:hypothetical protein